MATNIQTGIPSVGYTNGFQFMAGVGGVRGSTIPGNSSAGSSTSGAAATTSAGSYNGPLATTSFLGEPFAVWLGMILLLFLLKFLAEQPGVKILGENVNPAFIRIGGYNFLAIGISSAIFVVMMKVIFNKVRIPGLTEFTNAL